MAERVLGTSVSASAYRKPRQSEIPGSPSVSSDVLSGSAIPSSLVEFDGDGSGWVLFSPQIVPDNDPIELNRSRNSLLHDSIDYIEPLDLGSIATPTDGEASRRTSTPKINQASDADMALDADMQLDSSLELPAHNGMGSFPAPLSNTRSDLFERVNAWRIEQSELPFNDSSAHGLPGDYNQRTLWQKLKETTMKGIDHYLSWDDETIDALFNKDFTSKQRAKAEASDAARGRSRARRHFQRALKHGPPGWEDRILKQTLYKQGHAHEDRRVVQSGLLLAVLSRWLLWSRPSGNHDEVPAAVRTNDFHSRRRSFAESVLDHDDHSYHLDAIQGSIATITSTMTAVPWSDTWETGTSTSLGVAAAA